MPRNSSGTYSLPIAAFSPGGVIKSGDHNSNYSDIATALTQSLATTGVSTMTGPILAASGTAGAPSVTFSSSPTTGFYLAGVNQIGWAAAGAAAGTFNAAGSVTLNGALSVGGVLSAVVNATVGGALAVTGAITQGGVGVTAFPAGTRTFFAQAAAPTAWTQVVTYNDYALRLVSGAGAGTAGTKNFSSIFNAAITNLAQHNHGVTDPGHSHTIIGVHVLNGGANTASSLGSNTELPISSSSVSTTGITINNNGSGATTAFDVLYLDIILCQKN